MADSKPEWIPEYVWSILLSIQTAPKRGDSFCLSVEKLLTDASLEPIWKRLSTALISVEHGFQVDAASGIIGGICNPLRHYAVIGTADSPSFKVITRQKRDKAQSHLEKASDYLRKAICEIHNAREASLYLPDEASGLAGLISEIFERSGHAPLANWGSSYFLNTKFDTLDFLHELAEKLVSDNVVWANVPGMRSNKASWRDWLAEAVTNLAETSDIRGADFSLREADWVALAKVLIDPAISRSSVNAALRKIHL